MAKKLITLCLLALLLLAGSRCQSDDSDILGDEEVLVEAKEEKIKVETKTN